MPADGLDAPPMLPLIARDAKFVFCTDLELQQFATNAALVAQLDDALACWLSHIGDIRQERADMLDSFDQMPSISPAAIEPLLRQLELALSFPIHFERKEVLACLRLLNLIPAAAPKLQRLSAELEEIRQFHEAVVQALAFVSQAAVFVPHDVPWSIRDTADTIPPLFSSLRALWVCTSMFGPKHVSRFSAIVVYVVERVAATVHTNCKGAIDRILDHPSTATAVKQDLVAAQDAIVAVQEKYYELQASQTECGVLNRESGLHLVLSDVDDEALFAAVEWQFERLRGILMCVDALRADPNKIGSALTDPFVGVDLLDPSVMSQGQFMKAAGPLLSESAPSADAILDRMASKADTVAKKQRSGAEAAAAAARIPFHLLGNGLIVMMEFNPPVVTLVGGPLSTNCLDMCQYMLPLCCSNATVRSLTRKTKEVMFLPIPIVRRKQHVTSTAADDVASSAYSYSGASVSPQATADEERELLAQDPTNRAMQLVIHEQFCDEAHKCHMMATLLDIIDTEDAWDMTDTMANTIGAGKELFVMHFRKHRRSRSRSLSPENNEAPEPTQMQPK